MKLIKTTHIVKSILINHPITRGNDYILWAKVIEHWGICNGFLNFAERVTVKKFLYELRYMDCPCFSTVSRARRKLQRKYPELRAQKNVQDARAELEEVYREYALTNV